MAYIECGNGHLYDPSLNASCPYCSGNSVRIDFAAESSEIGRTAPVSGGYGTAPVSEVGSTVAPSSYSARKVAAENKAVKDDDAGKTVAVFKKKMNLEPVVGWIVCVQGPEKGKDFRILAKNNTIGRDEKMDICIKGDTTVSRENHARLAYDAKHNAFHLIPADGANTVYLNDEPVYVPAKLNDHDMIEIGESKFLFVPFCDSRFVWQEETKTGE